MRKIYLQLILLTISFTAKPQNLALIDSLMIEASSQSNDSVKAEVYAAINYQWAEYDFDTAWHYANKMMSLAERLDNSFLIVKAIKSRGIAFDYQNEFDSAIYYYSLARDYAKDHDDKINHAKAVFDLGVVHSFKGEMEQALENYAIAGKVFEELGNLRMQGILHNNMGIIYRKTGKYELAKQSYKNSLALKEQRNDVNGVLNTLTNISATYRFLNQYDSAIIVSEQAIFIAKKLNNQTAYLHEVVNLALAYEEIENSNAANELYKEADGLINENTPYETRAHVLNSLTNFYYNSGDIKSAQNYSQRMKSMVDENSKLEIAYEHYNLSYLINEAVGNTKAALSDLKTAMKLKTELLDNEVLSKATELEQLYEKEKREAEIAQLNAENELQSVELEKRRKEQIALIAGVILIFVIAVLLFILFRQKRKSLEERDVLLKEIHHRVKNNLQVISSLLNLQADSLDDETAKDAVKEGQHRVKSMALIHQKLYSADDVRGVDVQGYLEQLTSELFKAFGVDSQKVNWKIDTSGLRLDIDTVIPMGLIINELITNSIKYAFQDMKDGLLEISLSEKGENLNLSVKDNGQGMDEEALKSSNSFGWKMIKSLSRKLKAEITINNDAGTNVQLSLSRYKLIA